MCVYAFAEKCAVQNYLEACMFQRLMFFCVMVCTGQMEFKEEGDEGSSINVLT